MILKRDCDKLTWPRGLGSKNLRSQMRILFEPSFWQCRHPYGTSPSDIFHRRVSAIRNIEFPSAEGSLIGNKYSIESFSTDHTDLHGNDDADKYQHVFHVNSSILRLCNSTTE